MIWSFFSGQKAASPRIGFMTWLVILPITIFLSYNFEFWAQGHLGLHVFSVFVVVFVFLAGYRQIPIAWVYPLAFLSCVVPDVVSAGNQIFWKFTAFSGVGGAGFMDGNFLVPIASIMATILMRYVVEHAVRWEAAIRWRLLFWSIQRGRRKDQTRKKVSPVPSHSNSRGAFL